MTNMMMMAAIVAVAAYALSDYLGPRIATWLKIAPDNRVGVMALKYGTVGAMAVGSFWAIEHFFKK